MRFARPVALSAIVPMAAFTAVELSSTGPAGAKAPGPTGLPAVQLVVDNACTGGPVSGLTATLTPTSGETNPGPTQKKHGVYQWSSAAVAPGSYALSLSAPGFTPIGGAATGSPITVTKDPGPPGLVADSFFDQGVVISVMMVPQIYPPNPCLGLPALSLPEVAGGVFEGTTKTPLTNPGPISLTSVTAGESNPGPINEPNGHFVFPAGAVTPGPSTLSVAALGYLALGTEASGGVNPVAVTVNPGPTQLPSGGSFSEGQAVLIGLAPAP
jgi:hypothetical protein